jgi:hypothetical protein
MYCCIYILSNSFIAKQTVRYQRFWSSEHDKPGHFHSTASTPPKSHNCEPSNCQNSDFLNLEIHQFGDKHSVRWYSIQFHVVVWRNPIEKSVSKYVLKRNESWLFLKIMFWTKWDLIISNNLPSQFAYRREWIWWSYQILMVQKEHFMKCRISNVIQRKLKERLNVKY